MFGASILFVGLAVEDPEAVARAYLSAVEGMAWEAVVHRIHPEAAEGFRRYLEIMLFQDADPSELAGREAEATSASGLPLAEALQAVSGVGAVSAYLELDDRAVLLEAFRGLQRDSPGLINAWVDRSTEVLGVVPEGDTLRHVIYRLEWGISGARADVEVLTLATGPGGAWLVRTARELESLRPAISAIFRRAPPGDAGRTREDNPKGHPEPHHRKPLGRRVGPLGLRPRRDATLSWEPASSSLALRCRGRRPGPAPGRDVGVGRSCIDP